MRCKGACFASFSLLLCACGGRARAALEGPSASGSSGASAAASGSTNAGAHASSGGTAASSGGTAASSGCGASSSGRGGGSNDAGIAGASPVTHAALPCASPIPRAHGGGYATCSDGSLRRPSAQACEVALPRAQADMPIVFDECTTDADCAASPYGYCAYGACKYGCATDAECASDQACFCGDSVGICVPAQCRSDADCPAEFPCTGFQAAGFPTPDALACQSPYDECLTDSQCHNLSPRVTCKVEQDRRMCVTDPIG